MIVGLFILDLSLPGCDTLKEKRHRLKGLIEKSRNKFNVSASEVDYHDLHQSALIAFAMVNEDKELIEKVFSRIEELFEMGNGVTIAGTETEWY